VIRSEGSNRSASSIWSEPPGLATFNVASPVCFTPDGGGRRRKSIKDRKFCKKWAYKGTIPTAHTGTFTIAQEKAASRHFEQARLLCLGLLGIDRHNSCARCENAKASRYPERIIGSDNANGLPDSNAFVPKPFRNVSGALDQVFEGQRLASTGFEADQRRCFAEAGEQRWQILKRIRCANATNHRASFLSLTISANPHRWVFSASREYPQSVFSAQLQHVKSKPRRSIGRHISQLQQIWPPLQGNPENAVSSFSMRASSTSLPGEHERQVSLHHPSSTMGAISIGQRAARFTRKRIASIAAALPAAEC